LLAASQGSGKGNKKKKSVNPLNLETAAVPSSTDVTGETMEVNPKDFSKEPDAVPVPVQGVTISESCAVSVKEKHTDPVQEDGRPSSQGESLDCANLYVLAYFNVFFLFHPLGKKRER
jgi:hypothetical protein